MLKEEITRIAKEILDQVITDRRHLHANPELSFREYETSAFIKSRLDEMGISWKAMADTGVVAEITGEKPSGKVVALRADIDALPIIETTNATYASRREGIMHACGHDVHTSSLLGTAHILQSVKNQFGGTVRLIFQPAEETLPGGAEQMIREGVLTNPHPQAIIGQHAMPSIAAGKIAVRKGKFMASMDELNVTVYGKGGHGAQPHLNTDPVIIAAHILIALQQIVSRMAHPAMPTVLSFGKLTAAGSINVIPSQVHLEGTFRTLDEDWRFKAHEQMKKMASGIAESMGGRCEFNIKTGYPSLINEDRLTGQVIDLAKAFAGTENVVETDIWMAAEDFAYYGRQTDGCFYLLGTGNAEKGIVSSLHTSGFDIDENALATSTGLMAYLAVKLLGN